MRGSSFQISGARAHTATQASKQHSVEHDIFEGESLRQGESNESSVAGQVYMYIGAKTAVKQENVTMKFAQSSVRTPSQRLTDMAGSATLFNASTLFSFSMKKLSTRP